MLIAQISDMHVTRPGGIGVAGADTIANLERVVERIAGLSPRPDLVLATGDLVAGHGRGEYEALRALLAPLPMPVYLIPGNHDDRAALRAAFPDHGYLPRDDGFLHYTIEDDAIEDDATGGRPMRLIGLDTLDPGEVGGRLCQARLGWLAARLAERPESPTVVFMHHPPFDTGLPGMDKWPFPGRDALATIVAANPQVERVLCGHIHRPVQVRWAGTLAGICPSTAVAAGLILDPEAPFAWSHEAPAYQLHLWRNGTGLISHTVTVPDGD
jgi:Icc protein